MSKPPKKIKLPGATQVGFLAILDDLNHDDVPSSEPWTSPIPRREATIALLSWAGMVDASGEIVRGGRFDYLTIPPGTNADLLLAAAGLVADEASSESELADRLGKKKGHKGDAAMAQKAADALSNLSLKLSEESKKAPPRATQAPEDLGLDFPTYPMRPAVAPEDKPIQGDEKSRRKSLEIHLSEWFTTRKETVNGKEVSIPSLYNPNTLASTIIRILEGEDNPTFYDPKAKGGSILRRGFWHITKAYDLTPAQAKWFRSLQVGGQTVNPSSVLSYFFPIDAANHAKSPIGNKQDFAQAVKNGMKRVGVWSVERAVREWGIDDLAAFERAGLEPVKPDYGWADERRYSEVGDGEGEPRLLRGPAPDYYALDTDPEPAWWDEDSDQEPPLPPVLDGELREMLREASVAFSNYEPVSVVLFAAINRAYGGGISIQTWKDFDRILREMHDAQSWFDFFYNAAKIKQYTKDFKEFLRSIEDQENAFEDAALEGKDLFVEFVFNKIVKGVFGIHNKGKDTNGMTVVSVGTGSTEGMTSWDSHSISFTARDVYFFESDLLHWSVGSKIKHVVDVDYKFFVESILKIITDAKQRADVIYSTLKAFSDESAKNVCREGEDLYIFSDGTRVSTWKYKDSGSVRDAALMLEGKIVREMREVLKRPIDPPCGPSFYRNPPPSLSPPRAEPNPDVIVRPPPPTKPAPAAKRPPAAKPAPVAAKPAPAAKTASQQMEELAEMFDGKQRAEMLAQARAMREVEEIVRLAAEARSLGLGAFANTMNDLAALMGD